MARGSKARLEAFAQALAAGHTPEEAAKIAKYPRGSSFAANARKRAQRKDVKAMVAELRAPGVAKVKAEIAHSVEAQIRDLCTIAYAGFTGKIKPGDKVNAHRLIAQIEGSLGPEKHELTGKDGEPLFKDITDADRVKALAVFIARTRKQAAKSA